MDWNALRQPIILIVVAASTGLLTTWFWTVKAQRRADRKTHDEHKKEIAETLAAENRVLMQRVSELEMQTRLLGQQVLPIWTASQAILIKELTHFHTPVMDALMLKLGPPFALSEAEEAQLIAALIERTKDMSEQISDSERNAAHMLPFLIPRARAESVAMQNVRMVVLPADVSQKK